MIPLLTRWCVLGVMVSAAGASPAFAQLALRPELPSPSQSSLTSAQGELHGVVRDDRGKPIAGAVVSALGSMSVFAVSDADGHFTFRALPAGPYLVRAHLRGYLGERGRLIQVSPNEHSTWTIALTRQSSDSSPTVLAAGVGPSEPATPSPDSGSDDHGEVAWRLRHAPRSVLKDAETTAAAIGDEPSLIGDSLAELGRAVGTPARLASALFADVPLNTQINFLTTTSF